MEILGGLGVPWWPSTTAGGPRACSSTRSSPTGTAWRPGTGRGPRRRGHRRGRPGHRARAECRHGAATRGPRHRRPGRRPRPAPGSGLVLAVPARSTTCSATSPSPTSSPWCTRPQDEAYGKPHPAVFLGAAARLGVAPERCVVFEDAAAGVLAAKAARMVCVAVPDAGRARPAPRVRPRRRRARVPRALRRAGLGRPGRPPPGRPLGHHSALRPSGPAGGTRPQL